MKILSYLIHLMRAGWPFALVVSVGMALLNSIAFFYGVIHEPTGTVYLGTIHYWEDYFIYLNHFFQGAHGAGLAVNRYTSELTPASIIYWCNVLLGKLGGLVGLPTVLSYNMSIIILSFASLLLSYLILRHLFFKTNERLAFVGFLFATLSTSLINYVKSNEGPMIFWPFQIWRTPHFAFDRLGGAPHQLVQTILFYVLILLTFSPNTHQSRIKLYVRMLATLVVAVLLTTVNPIQSAVFVACLLGANGMVMIKTRKHSSQYIDELNALLLAITVGLGFLYTSHVLNGQPHIQSKLWEAVQHSYTTWSFLFLSLGPVLVFFSIIGIASKIKTFTLIEWFGALLLTSGYALFMSPIPHRIGFSNLRVLFPASYIFWGAFASYGQSFICTYIEKRFAITSFITSTILVCIFLATTMPTLYWEVWQKIPKEKDNLDPMVYLPIPVYAAFDFLSNELPYDDVVLANPSSHMDTLIPAISGHTTYSGHMLATTNNAYKQKQATAFFSGQLTTDVAKSFLVTNRITYILVTAYDTSFDTFSNTYPFLKIVKTFGKQAMIYSL